MIVDSSALIAILRAESDAEQIAAVLASAPTKRMSAANYLETCVVIDQAKDPIASRRVDDLIKESGIVVVTVTKEHADIARSAYRDFGKRSASSAQLNFGDCFAYALARVSGEPLLFKGNDFIHTDLASALAPDEPR